jgi:hypothetical protein
MNGKIVQILTYFLRVRNLFEGKNLDRMTTEAQNLCSYLDNEPLNSLSEGFITIDCIEIGKLGLWYRPTELLYRLRASQWVSGN